MTARTQSLAMAVHHLPWRRDFGDGHDPAAVMEDLFEANSWGDTWRDGIYSYVHYHSRIHEVLGIARGKGRVRFGGNKGRIFTLKAGDVAILHAGTGHQCLFAEEDFLVVGAYSIAVRASFPTYS